MRLICVEEDTKSCSPQGDGSGPQDRCRTKRFVVRPDLVSPTHTSKKR
jgi:hypothetical protein